MCQESPVYVTFKIYPDFYSFSPPPLESSKSRAWLLLLLGLLQSLSTASTLALHFIPNTVVRVVLLHMNQIMLLSVQNALLFSYLTRVKATIFKVAYKTYMIWLQLLLWFSYYYHFLWSLCLIQTGLVADSWICEARFCLRVFAVFTIPLVWKSLPPDTHGADSLSYLGLLKYTFLMKFSLPPCLKFQIPVHHLWSSLCCSSPPHGSYHFNILYEVTYYFCCVCMFCPLECKFCEDRDFFVYIVHWCIPRA